MHELISPFARRPWRAGPAGAALCLLAVGEISEGLGGWGLCPKRDLGLPRWVDAQRVFPQCYTSLWGLGILEPSESESTELLGSLLKPSQHSPAPYCFSASPLQDIRPEAHKNLMGEAGTVFCGGKGDCFILEPRCLISILATCSYLILHK